MSLAPSHSIRPGPTGGLLLILLCLPGLVLDAQDPFLETLTTQGQELAPRQEVPTRYLIALELEGLGYYRAKQLVTYTNNEDVTLEEVVFHVYPNADYMVEGRHGRNILLREVLVDGEPITPREEGTVVTVPLHQPLGPGENVRIDMLLVGRLPHIDDGSDLTRTAMEQLLSLLSGDGAMGGGLRNYGIFGTTGQIDSMALWHPLVAAHDHRGWDRGSPEEMGDFSYFDAANYHVVVRAPKDLRIAAGGLVTDRVITDTYQQVSLTAGRARELTLQVSADYRRASGEVGEVQVSSWFLEGHGGTGMEILTHAMRAVSVFEEEFGPYPYRELDVAEAPLLGGVAGVEFPGLCTIATMFYRDAGQTQDPMSMMMASPYMEDTLEFVVAHEVAHQWWNATVGSDSRTHPFVDEALANYSAVRYFEVVHGPARARKILQTQVTLNYHMSRMMGQQDRPVDLPTGEFQDMVQYVATVYGKGAMFYMALRDAVGEEAFAAALQEYYRDRYLRVAGPEDLPRILQRVVPEQAEEVEALCQRWLHESHGDEDMGTMDTGELMSMMLEMLMGTDEELDPWLKLFTGAMELMSQYDWEELLGEGW